ncbi:MAG: acyl--CoA ligase [Gammaproteobacteria bacterium]|nr:acyl--CoA ligase [Gammaproteobacteria bacterium]
MASSTLLLDDAWTDSASFLLIPEKIGIRPAWLDRIDEIIPPDYHIGCFGILTSGSTGEPKLILGSKQRSENLARALHQVQDSEAVAETICALPLSYSYAFINQWLWSHVHKRRLVLTRGFSEPDRLQLALSQAKDAMLCLVGGQLALLRQFFAGASFPGIIRLHFAGGRFPQEQLDFLQERFPHAKIYNNYGCAEAMPRLTLRPAEAATAAAHIGYPLPGIEIIADSEHRLLFRSPYRAVAFVDQAGFHPVSAADWLPSGDLAEPLEDGGWRLLGRANEVFKRYGEKISLPQLLTTIKQAWQADAAFYLEQDANGEQGCVLVLSPAPEPQELQQILMALRHNHPRPHWPLRIESLAALPLLANGKTDVHQLAAAEHKALHWKQRI